jgi:putative endonuclease
LPRKRGKGSRAETYVSRLYEKAGYRVRRNVRSRAGEIDILAKRGNEKLLVEVKSGKQILTSTDVMKVARKAKYHHAKPVIRKSKRAKLTNNATDAAKKYGVRIRDY